MAIKTALLSVGGTVAMLGLLSGIALAGGPAYCGVAGCDTGVSYVPSPTGHSGPTTIENRTPYDFLDSVHFQRSPHVSITRVHGMAPNVGLADAPGGFTQGCHPQSTTYCRSGHQGSAAVSTTSVRTASVAAPTYVPPPVMQAPIVAPQPHMPRPHVQERVVAIGGGFDPSKFTPRIYGDPYTITPGIAYLPTSIVDRNPYRAQAVLDAGPGGVTPALTGMPIGPLPTPRPPAPVMMHQPMMQPPNVHVPRVQPYMTHPRPPYMSGPQVQPSIPTGYPGAAGAPYKMTNGRYGSTVGADGTYWEKVSGPTQIGNTVATQVICKRRLPQPAPTYYPTPYPAPQPMPPVMCNAQAQHPGAHKSGQRSRY
ncbi:hypothetical protein GCM10009069_27050 [Algimonas arctica]|uniref:Uncharacterized protein n=1 Tax=Algimonas arctica TaxID=1479486 RepID=A0A8J3CSD6_9PROT|nr:hypothetical protein [Algimonas arctica]GHB02882.1 hypothetical protein GCM10009069_27050 [Algimonas arctica]